MYVDKFGILRLDDVDEEITIEIIKSDAQDSNYN